MSDTFTVNVIPGSGVSKPLQTKRFVVFPEPPVNGQSQIWLFDEYNQPPPTQGQYENLNLLFTDELRGPQDSFRAIFTLSDSDGHNWRFVSDPPYQALNFKEADEHHDVSQTLKHGNQVLEVIFTFNQRATERLDYYFLATYEGNTHGPISSLDPTIVVDRKPPLTTPSEADLTLSHE